MQEQAMPCPTCGHMQEELYATVTHWPLIAVGVAAHWLIVLAALSVILLVLS